MSDCRRLHSGELYDLCSPNVTRVIKSRRMRGVYRILVGKPDGKRPLGRPRRRWEGNITMDLQAVGLEQGMDLSGSQGQVTGSCE